MLKKAVEIEVPITKKFSFNFDIEGVEHTITSWGTSEVNALMSLQGNIHSIELDINNELRDVDVTSTPKERAVKKKVTAPLKDKKEVVQDVGEVVNGIVINHPKKVNNPGFQPKFIERVD